MPTLAEDLDAVIATVPDFPVPGIMFKDICPVLARPDLMDRITTVLSDYYWDSDTGKPTIDVIVGGDARGFLFGPALSSQLGVPFVMARKPGKLPGPVITKSYDLEYGTNTLAMQAGSVKPGQRVLFIDDLLATGGTAKAACELIERMGGVATCAFVIELDALAGRAAIGRPCYSLLHY